MKVKKRKKNMRLAFFRGNYHPRTKAEIDKIAALYEAIRSDVC